jgi:hypothetical protein
MVTGGMESLIELGQQIDQMTFEPLTMLQNLEVEDGNIDPNLGNFQDLSEDDQAALELKAGDDETGGSGYYTKIDGEWTKLGTAESVIRQGVASFIIEQLTNFGSKVPEVMKSVVTRFIRAMGQ